MTPVNHDRLRSGRDISKVLRGRRQRAGRLLVLHARPRDTGAGTRVAVIASKRVGNAVARNRAKRLLREAARQTPLPPRSDIVLVARPGCVHAPLASVRDELVRLGAKLDATRGADERPHTVLAGSQGDDHA